MFHRADLDELLGFDEYPCVSLYFATHPAGREVRQDAIRLRNLLSTAAKRLSAKGRGAADELLEPARKLVDDEDFWRYQAQGLALFLAPGFDRVHKLPIEVEETMAIGRHFRLTPLLSLIDDACRFLVLTVTGGRTRLYQGSRWSFAEMRGLDLPQGISTIWNETVYEEAHNAAPVGRPGRGPGGLAKAQAFGDAPDDLHKSQLIELLHRVARAVEPVIKRDPVPVVLAAAPEIQGNFRELAHWKELLPAGILENPDAMAADDLHKKAWRLIEPRHEQSRADALGRLESLLGSGAGKTATKPEEIVKAAHWGRVDRLFLSAEATLWGRFEADQDKIVARRDPGPDDDDLFDYAVLMTLRQGGGVTLVDRTQLPPDGPAAAILRY